MRHGAAWLRGKTWSAGPRAQSDIGSIACARSLSSPQPEEPLSVLGRRIDPRAGMPGVACTSLHQPSLTGLARGAASPRRGNPAAEERGLWEGLAEPAGGGRRLPRSYPSGGHPARRRPRHLGGDGLGSVVRRLPAECGWGTGSPSEHRRPGVASKHVKHVSRAAGTRPPPAKEGLDSRRCQPSGK